MGYQVYLVGKRYGGYGVPAICEYPDCNEEIDRGMSFACGGEPFSEIGCDRYFCSKHRKFTGFKAMVATSDVIMRMTANVRRRSMRAMRCWRMPVPFKPEHPTG